MLLLFFSPVVNNDQPLLIALNLEPHAVFCQILNIPELACQRWQ